MTRVLVVEDSATDAKLIVKELERAGHALVHLRVEDADAMRDALSKEEWDIVLSDWRMPHFDALGALEVLAQSGKDIPFVIVSGTIGEEAAVTAMRAGAHDYVSKEKLARLGPVVERELRDASERAAHRIAQKRLRETEEQLRQSQKMEAIGRLAGGVAHDFNNLLTVILGYGHVLTYSLEDPELKDAAVEICTASERAANLTRQLLVFSRRQFLTPSVIDIATIVSEMEKMLGRVLGEDVDLVFDVRSTGRTRIDPTSVEQIVMNLVVNARDAMPTGGKLTITTEDVIVDDAFAATHVGGSAGPHVRLAVCDTGTGMDEATRDHVFEPFFTTKPQGKGTGLGLSTVFGIVRQSSAMILLETTLGAGTTFNIYFPCVNDADVATADHVVTLPTLNGTETILVVEDDEQVRATVRASLERHGYKVVVARTGDEAMLLTELHAIHLLLTDVVMPGMSGPELVKKVRALRPTLPVLCMSGYTDDDVARHGFVEGDVAFIQKPMTPSVLARKVRAVLDGHKSASPGSTQ